MHKHSSLKQTGVALAIAQLFTVNASSAATINVDSGADDRNLLCTFREAVEIINLGAPITNGCSVDDSDDPLGTNDSIEFNDDIDTITFEEGEILITADVTINTDSDFVSLKGDQTSRLLRIDSDNGATSPTVTINDMGLTGGSAMGGTLSAQRGGAITIENNSSITINDSEISGNNAVQGGGIYASQSDVTINDSIIGENTSSNNGGGVKTFGNGNIIINRTSIINNNSNGAGGGLYSYGADNLTISHSSISANVSQGNGGGLSSYSSGSLNITNSAFSDNEAFSSGYGGGIYTGGAGARNISQNTRISGNYAAGVGGGVHTSGSGSIIVSDATISANNSPVAGGGFYISGEGASTIINSTISDNSATYYGGGGIYALSFYSGASLTINATILSGNMAENGGGVVARLNGPTTINNSTIFDNSVSQRGGGILSSQSNSIVTVNNSTISGNTGDDGGGLSINVGSTMTLNNSTVANNIADSGGASVYGSVLTLNNSIIAGTVGSADCVQLMAGVYSNGSSNNIIENSQCSTLSGAPLGMPVDPLLAPLANNGGLTQTHALFVGSPAIDAASNTDCAAAPINNLDQRGVSRPVGANCDIGAFEGEVDLPEPETNFFVVPLPNGKSVIFGL